MKDCALSQNGYGHADTVTILTEKYTHINRPDSICTSSQAVRVCHNSSHMVGIPVATQLGRHRCAEDLCVLELKCRTVAIITELKGGMPVALPMCWRPMSLGVDEFSSWPSDETHRWPKDKIDDGPVAIVVSLPSRRCKAPGF